MGLGARNKHARVQLPRQFGPMQVLSKSSRPGHSWAAAAEAVVAAVV